MWRGEGVVRSDGLTVKPDARLPVRAFEKKHSAPAPPIRCHFEITLKPRRPHVVFFRLQPEGHFDISRLAILRHFRCGEPRLVHDAAGPNRVGGNVVPDPLPGQRAGQIDFGGQLPVKPALAQPDVRAVELKSPLAGERNLRCCERRTEKSPLTGERNLRCCERRTCAGEQRNKEEVEIFHGVAISEA